jgi:non-ribosomal peptide synthetase component F
MLLDQIPLQGDDSNPPQVSKAGNLAYIIYTSGSTGKPEGVLIEHGALASFCIGIQQDMQLEPEDRYGKVASIGFDASVLDIFATLAFGASIYLVPEEARLSPAQTREYFERHGISKTFCTTQFAEQMMELGNCAGLKILVTGGEKLKKYIPRNFKILNIYGPTECTVCCTTFAVDRQYQNIPIGAPMPNAALYILDPRLRPSRWGCPTSCI